MDIVKTIINAWDPIGLFPYAPSDEYNVEIKKIQDILLITNDLETISDEIFNIFTASFDNVFENTKEDCTKIAKEILQNLTII